MNRSSKLKILVPVMSGLLMVGLAGCDSPTTEDEGKVSEKAVVRSQQQLAERASKIEVPGESTKPSMDLVAKSAPNLPTIAPEHSGDERNTGNQMNPGARVSDRAAYLEPLPQDSYAESALEDPRMPSNEQQMREIARLSAVLESGGQLPGDQGLDSVASLQSFGNLSGASANQESADTSATDPANVDELRDEALYGQTAKQKIYALKELAESPDKGSPEVISVFNEALLDSDPTVRGEAIWTIYRGRVPVGSSSLFEVAKNDPDSDIRGRAYVTLVDRGGDEVREYLTAALQDPDPAIRESAQTRLDSLGSP